MTSLLTQRQPPEARETGGIARGIATLDEGRLYALQHPYALDGRSTPMDPLARTRSL
jgi:hypothetical protein